MTISRCCVSIRAMAKYELITFDKLGPDTVAFHEARAGTTLPELLADIVANRDRLEEGSSSNLPNSLACNDPTIRAEGALKLREETRAWLMLQILSYYRGADENGTHRYSLSGAYKKVHVSAMTIIKWREVYPLFSAQIQAVQSEMVETIREEAYRRAVVGHDEPLVHQGLKTGESVKKFSDTLLQFTLMGYDAKFRRQEVNMNHSGSIDSNVNIEGLRDKLAERLRAKAKAESDN